MVKKINVVLILLIFILSLSAVSAVDDISAVNSANDNIAIGDYNENPQDNGNTYTDLSNVIKNAEVNSTISLDKDYAYNNSDFQNYQKGIPIVENITINGNNHNILVTGADSAFMIKNANVTLKNINFKGDSFGPVIAVENGQLTLLNCSIQNVNRIIPVEGAIGDSFSVNDIIAIANHVENYYVETNVLPNNVIYNGKSYGLPVISQLLGQAILNYYANNMNDVSVTKLLGNPGSGVGSYNSSINYTQKAYISNTEGIERGGFTQRYINWCNSHNEPANYVGSTNGNLYYSSMVESFARALSYYGKNNQFPEFMNYYGNIKIAASTSGNGIYSYNSNLTIENTIFKNVTGNSNGGIYVQYGNILINNTIFENNTANRGAAIFVDSATDVIIDNSKFSSNMGTQKSTNGAVVNIYKSGAKITNSDFTDNKCLLMRGIIELKLNSESLIDNCTFMNNEAYEAAGIAADQSKKLTINNSKFISNGVSGSYGFGGVFNSQSTPIEIINSEFMNNFASGSNPWGGVGMFSGATFGIVNSTFVNNSVRNEAMSTDDDKNLGGAIFAQNSATVNIVNSIFKENAAVNKGGALYAQGNSNFIITDSLFVNNSARNGGAIYSKEGSVPMSVKDSCFKNNNATAGGAIFTDGTSSGDVSNSTFINNSANMGGAIVATSGCNVKNSYFENNSALSGEIKEGGAIYAFVLHLENSTFVNNIADNGGAISVQSHEYIYNSTFINNKANKSSVISLIYAMGGGNVNYNIFVNNTGENILSAAGTSDSINLDYNYWGVNSDPNSLIKKGEKTILNKWITIGIEGNSTIYAGSEALYNIAFQGENADKLPLFNTDVTLIPNAGTLKPSNISLNNKSSVGILINKAGNFTLVIGQEYKNLATYNITVLKINSSINVNADDTVYGKDVVVVAAVPSDAAGNVIFTVNGVNKTAVIDNGVASATFVGLTVGEYQVTATYSGDDKYLISTNNTKFNVIKAKSDIVLNINDIVYGDDVTVVANLAKDATGNVIFTVNGVNKSAVVVDGVASATFAGLGAGDYSVVASYAGDNNYKASNNSTKFSVSKADGYIEVVVPDNLKFGDNATIVANLAKDATGKVAFIIDGVSNSAVIDNGVATFNVVALTAGNHNVTVVYNGDKNYKAINSTKLFDVAKIDSNVKINVNDIVYGNNISIVATVPSDAAGNVIFTVNGVNKSAAAVDGKANVTFAGLGAGDYSVVASYAGDSNYKASNSTAKFNVAKADVDVKINVGDIKVGETAIITVIVSPGVTGNVTVIVNGKSETINVSDGNAILKVANLAANKYDVSAIYNGNDNYNVAKANASFVVSKVSDYKMNVTVPTIAAGENAVIEVSLPKDATNNVTVVINNKKYTAAVLNGSAKVIIPGLTTGKYNMSVNYSGDDKYTQSSANFNITVEANKNVNLNISDIVMIYKDGTKMVAVLTDYLGNPIANATVYFTINGKTYAKPTDANGTASMGLNLVSNIYGATVSYNGSDRYNAVSKNITVTINPTIISKDLVKMYQNATRFYAKFTDSTGKALANTVVKFNIHGVFYNKTTDKDGVADLGIMLRPGSYILTAYNPVTGEEKGFNITVKSLIMQNDLTKYYLNASRFEATVYNKDGSLAVNKNVTFNINGVFYTKTTDKNGVASLGIALRPGNYTITTMYDGLDIGNKVSVLSTLVTKDLSMKYLDGSNFTALTLDGQGKPLANQNVSFNVNGVFYHKVTNKDGIASLGIRLMSGEYIITSYWNDFQTGNTIKISS